MVNPANALAIVDDRSPLIKYDPAAQWLRDGAFLEFATTTSDSRTLGSTATFIFDGTSVIVYGTYNADPASIMNFSIDKTISGQFKTPATLPPGADAVHHEPLYTSPTLPAGPHTLVITQGATTPGTHIFLDYLIYSPSPNAASSGLTYIVDDNDTRVLYDKWTAGNSDANVQHTFHSSAGAGAKITFTFEGTGITVVGDIPRRLTVANMATIAIDGGPPTNFAPPIQILRDLNVGQTIYTSPRLTQGNHTLVLTTVGIDAFTVDYFLVVPGEITRPTAAPIPSSSPPVTTSKTPTTTKQTQTSSSPSITASSAAAAATTSTTNVGAIAGGSIAAVLALALAFMGFMFWRKRQGSSKHSDRISLTSDKFAPQPFTPVQSSYASHYGYPPNQAASNYAPSAYPAPSTYGGSNHAGYGAGNNYYGYSDPAAAAAYPGAVAGPGYAAGNPGYGPSSPGGYGVAAAAGYGAGAYGQQYTHSTGSQPSLGAVEQRPGYSSPQSPPLMYTPPTGDVKRRPPVVQNDSPYDAIEEGPSMLAYAESDRSPSPVSGGALPNPHQSRPPPNYTPH